MSDFMLTIKSSELNSNPEVREWLDECARLISEKMAIDNDKDWLQPGCEDYIPPHRSWEMNEDGHKEPEDEDDSSDS